MKIQLYLKISGRSNTIGASFFLRVCPRVTEISVQEPRLSPPPASPCPGGSVGRAERRLVGTGPGGRLLGSGSPLSPLPAT